MKIEMVLRLRRPRAWTRPLKIWAGWLHERMCERLPGRRWAGLTLVLTGDDEIRDLNARWFGKDRITDVISFRHPALPGEDGEQGELILNLEQAWHEGRLRDGPDRELLLYLAHGCDHLAGAEDDTPARKRAMLRREAAWIRAGLAEGLPSTVFHDDGLRPAEKRTRRTTSRRRGESRGSREG